jgi:hypothetical protein
MYTADTEARITIPDRLEAALERYRGGLETPPSLASVVQAALGEYLEDRGYPVGAGEVFEDEQEIMPAASPKSRGRSFDVPRLKDGARPVPDTVIEDRR